MHMKLITLLWTAIWVIYLHLERKEATPYKNNAQIYTKALPSTIIYIIKRVNIGKHVTKVFCELRNLEITKH